LDGEGKTVMSSLAFTTRPHPAWDKKIEEGLYKACEALTGLRKSLEPFTIYAESDGVFMGGITIEQYGDILWIDSLWVEPNFRKRGIGQELIQQAFLYATKRNATEVQLHTFFPTAHAFFLSQDFEDVAVVPNWKYGLDCYLMRKKL